MVSKFFIFSFFLGGATYAAANDSQGQPCVLPGGTKTTSSGSIVIFGTCERFLCQDGDLIPQKSSPEDCYSTGGARCITHLGKFVEHGSTIIEGNCTYTCDNGVPNAVGDGPCQKTNGVAAPACLIESGDVMRSGETMNITDCVHVICNSGVIETVSNCNLVKAAEFEIAQGKAKNANECTAPIFEFPIKNGTIATISTCRFACHNGLLKKLGYCVLDVSALRSKVSPDCILPDGRVAKNNTRYPINKCSYLFCSGGVPVHVENEECTQKLSRCYINTEVNLESGLTKTFDDCTIQCNDGVALLAGKCEKLHESFFSSCKVPDGRSMPHGATLSFDDCTMKCNNKKLVLSDQCTTSSNQTSTPDCLLPNGTTMNHGDFDIVDDCRSTVCNNGTLETYTAAMCGEVEPSVPCDAGSVEFLEGNTKKNKKCFATCVGSTLLLAGPCNRLRGSIEESMPMLRNDSCLLADGHSLVKGGRRQVGLCLEVMCVENGVLESLNLC